MRCVRGQGWILTYLAPVERVGRCSMAERSTLRGGRAAGRCLPLGTGQLEDLLPHREEPAALVFHAHMNSLHCSDAEFMLATAMQELGGGFGLKAAAPSLARHPHAILPHAHPPAAC